jgi:hypothetical protein
MSLDMLFAKIAALGVHGLRNARGSIAIGEVAGAGYECSPRTRAGVPVERCHILSAFTLGATPSMVPAPGLLPDLVPGPLHIYAYALHGELLHAWRRFEVRDGVGNWFDPIRIATGECEGDSGGLMDVVELPVFNSICWHRSTLGCLELD